MCDKYFLPVWSFYFHSFYSLIKNLQQFLGFQVAKMVKNLPAMWETCVQSLGQEDPLEKGMATHFSILAWKFPWREEPAGLQSWATVHGFAESDTTISSV